MKTTKEIVTMIFPEFVKGTIIYVCSVFICVVFAGHAFIRWLPSASTYLVYSAPVILGIGLGFVLNKRLRTIGGVAIMVFAALLAFGIGDYLAVHQ